MGQVIISSAPTQLDAGLLQLQGGVAMSTTLTTVTDQNNNASPLKLSTTQVQTLSTLKITTADNPYIDAEDNSGNNRFTVGRDPASQQVNVDFASNPTGGSAIVGAIRTYVDDVNLSEVMKFREDGQITAGYLAVMGSPINDTLAIHLGGSQVFQVGNPIVTNQYMVIDSVAGSKRGIKFGNQGSTRQGLFLNNNDLQIAECNATNYNPWLTVDYLSNGNVTIGAGATTSIGARLGVRGSGSTSATTSLLVQSSIGDQIFKVTDDGSCTVGRSGGSANGLSIYDTSGLNSIFRNGNFECPSVIARNSNGVLTFFLRNNNGQGVTFEHNNSQQSNYTGIAMVNIGGGYNTQQNAQFSSLQIAPTYNLQANTTTSSIARGIYYNPTITTLQVAQHYAWQNTSGAMIVNSSTPQASAILQADSTTQGFLPPRMTDAQIRAIASPVNGLVAFNTDINVLCCYQAGIWVKFSHSPM